MSEASRHGQPGARVQPATDTPAQAPGTFATAVSLSKLDQAMEDASVALVQRKYFAVERICIEALRTAIVAEDFERAARICMPLMEARRLKRQLAIDAAHVEIVKDPVGEGMTIRPGCYVVCPPRVGAEARTIRQLADAAEVPVVVIAREPATRAGLCPIVGVGPITVRAFVTEPMPALVKAAPKARKKSKASAPTPMALPPAVFGPWAPPPIEWILAASEALGDAAIAMSTSPVAADRACELFARLQSCPDHEKLHQRLMEACELAAREPRKKKATAPLPPELDEFGEGSLSSED